MFKWDRLIKNNKLPKGPGHMKDELEESSVGLYSEEDLPPNTLKNDEEFEIVEIEILPNKIICPDCGGITLEGLEFCDKCGGEI